MKTSPAVSALPFVLQFLPINALYVVVSFRCLWNGSFLEGLAIPPAQERLNLVTCAGPVRFKREAVDT